MITKTLFAKKLIKSTSYKKNCSSLGFTLVELMVVIIIIGILSGLAIASTGSTYEDEMRQDAQNLANTLEEAYRQSITHSAWWRIYNLQFRFTSTSYQWCVYTCSYVGTVTYPKSPIHSLSNTSIVKYAYFPHIDGTNTPTTYSVSSTWKYIYYLVDGAVGRYSAYTFPTGATIYLQHNKDPNIQYKIVVYPISGRTMIYDHW